MTADEDPIQTTPLAIGSYGRLWRMAPPRAAATEPRADVASWMIEAPWAHPQWHSYAVTMVHLRHVPGLEKAVVKLPGATHEFALWAIDPNLPRQPQIDGGGLECLHPANFAAEIIADSDAAARERIEGTLMLILSGDLTPDSDGISAWVSLFGDSRLRKPLVDA